MSFPTRERGLKFTVSTTEGQVFAVVPHAGTWIEIVANANIVVTREVVPHAGTWIEMWMNLSSRLSRIVVPHAGTWIEIIFFVMSVVKSLSFPTRERGLKYEILHNARPEH